MARLGFKFTSQVQTRDKYTKCDMELGMTLDGKELPNAAVLGSALEDAVKLIQDRITESYQVVPVRAEAPVTAQVTNVPEPGGLPSVVRMPEVVPVVPTLGQQIAPDPVPANTQSGLGFPPGYSQQ